VLISLFQSPVIFTYKGPVSKQTERGNASLKSTGLCSSSKGLSVTITTAIQPYGIWQLPQNFRVYAEFREILRKHGNSAATAKFCGSAGNSAARGKLWALVITIYLIFILVTAIFIGRHKWWSQVGWRVLTMWVRLFL